jgi:Holliday junction resolvase RusA-like endonuclease
MMGKIVKFIVEGECKGKGRPRFRSFGKFVSTYTPKETKEAEQNFINQANAHKPETPFTGPIAINVSFYKVKPKSRKKFESWTTKNDLDNMLKLVLDAMNGIFFKDDAQIVSIMCDKRYGDKNCTLVEMEELEGN